MKTYYFSCGPIRIFSTVGLMALLITSCGSYQNSSSDNDGIYGNGSQRTENQQSAASNYHYKDYFGSLQGTDEQVEIFTDVNSYRTIPTDSIDNRTTYATGNAGWGSDNDNIVVNVYDNNWGYGMWNNYWYSGWGWNVGMGWNSWYGPGWGMGWNNWYGPGWGWNSYYYPYYGVNNYYYNNWNHYAHHDGIRGVRNNMYGSSRSSANRSYATGRRVNSAYSNGTRSTSYSTTRNTSFNNTRNSVQSSTRGTTRQSTYNSQSTPIRQSNAPTRSYTPTRSTPSSGGVRPSGGGGTRSSGGGSYGGGGGRSGGSGGRR